MSRIAEYFKNRICLWLLPLLLIGAVGSVLIDCYAQGGGLLLKAAFLFYALAAFVLFDRLQKWRILGGILYTVLLLLALAFTARMIFSAEYTGQVTVSFQQWFYGIGVSDDTEATAYMVALFIGGGFFIDSVMYYFTQIQYRALGTLLIIFIPFVIYAKRDDIISDLNVTMIITLFLAIIVHNRLFLDRDGGKGTLVNTAYIMSIALFVSVTGALAVMFPDFSKPSKLEKDSSFLNFSGINGGGTSKLDNSDSSTHFHGVQYTNEPLFYLYPEDMKALEKPIYLRRRSMNAYDSKRLDWYVSSDLKDEMTNGVYGTLEVAFPSLYAALRDKGLNGELSVDKALFEKDYKENVYSFELEFEENVGSVPYVPAPLYSYAEYDDGQQVPMGLSDMFYVYENTDAKNIGRITITAINCASQAKEFASAAGGLYKEFGRATDRALNVVSNMADRGESVFNNGKAKKGYEFEAFMADYYESYYRLVREHYFFSPNYLKETGLKDYDKIKDLADEICKDCESDYQKAKAIEQYFTNEGFEYDLEYIPEDESVSYFLFESKRGICIDFASAMGVMMIMEGVPVRYVEGFVAFERDPEDSSRIVVRDSHAHAFIEAFIPYVGWMTFDPTVEGYMREGAVAEEESDSGMLTVILAYLGRILLVMGVIFVLIFIILFDRIWEILFRVSMRFYQPDKKLTRLYNHIFKLLEYEDKTDLEPYTARLLNDYLRQKTGSSLPAVTDLFEQHRFGGREVSEEQFNAAYEAYKALYPKIRKKGGTEQLTVNG